MWNMNENGFIIGTANRSNISAHAGWWPPKTTHDGTRELIIIIETCGANRYCFHWWLFSRVLHTIKVGILRLQMKSMSISPIVRKVWIWFIYTSIIQLTVPSSKRLHNKQNRSGLAEKIWCTHLADWSCWVPPWWPPFPLQPSLLWVCIR